MSQVENHPLVTTILPPHLWELSPRPSSSSITPSSSSRQVPHRQNILGGSTIIATISVKIKKDASDSDILTVGNFVRERCGPAFRSVSADAPEGELTVEVTRERGISSHSRA